MKYESKETKEQVSIETNTWKDHKVFSTCLLRQQIDNNDLPNSIVSTVRTLNDFSKIRITCK